MNNRETRQQHVVTKVLLAFLLLSVFISFTGSAEAARLSAGQLHTIAVKSDGTVWAWGYNFQGQLGTGTYSSNTVPGRVPGLDNVISVAAGGWFTAVLRSDGTVWTFGDNSRGQLGVGTYANIRVPTRVPGLSGVVAIAAGTYHAAAVKADGTVWAWGYNYSGQLGDGTNTSSAVPVRVSGIGNVASVAAGQYHTVAMKADGTVWAWGNNGFGQLGNGTTSDSNVPVQAQDMSNAVSVAAGAYHTAALKSDGAVWTWGHNGSGRLGNGTNSAFSSVPVPVTGLRNTVSIAAGMSHTLALESDGTVLAWGENGSGQLGNGTTVACAAAVRVNAAAGIVSVSAGANHSLAVKADGTVLAWGENGYYELGNGTMTQAVTPVPATGFADAGITQAAFGANHSTGLRADGTVWTWGKNTYGALGLGMNADRIIPIQVPGLDSLVAVDAGAWHTTARKADGTVLAWGGNADGELGNSSPGDSLSPVPVTGLTDVKSIETGANALHTLALKSDGTVWSWGANSHGQLGNNSTVNASLPVQTPGLSSVRAVSGGADFSLALLADGTVMSWGNNADGELGNGTTTNSLTPVSVSGLSDVVSISAGQSHAVALKTDGTVWSWGYLYDGSAMQIVTAPVQIAGLNDMKAVAAGVWYTIALKSDGTVWGWGFNGAGQLGNGTQANSGTPVPVQGLSGVVQITAAWNQAAALKADGTLWAWGDNRFGQLGDGGTELSTVPVPVRPFAPSYTITATAGAGGTISPSEPVIVSRGKAQTYTITPDSGYHIVGVAVDGAPMGRLSSYTFDNVLADHTISVEFAIDRYTITAWQTTGGDITPPGATEADHGSSLTYAITPYQGYSLLGVYVDMVSVGSVTSYTFSNVTANHFIYAEYAAVPYTITASAGPNGTISPAGDFVKYIGDYQRFTISAAPGYRIADVLIDGVPAGPLASFTFSEISANHAITALFTPDVFTITAAAYQNGRISPAGVTTLKRGESITYTITPDAGYEVQSLIVDGANRGAVTSFTLSSLAADHTITAYFKMIAYSVVATAGPGGAINPLGTTILNIHGSQTYAVTPSAGYHVADVQVDGASVGAISAYSFTDVTTNHTISATFAANSSYTITANAVGSGTISPAGTVNVLSGASRKFTFTPQTGYRIADVQVDGVSVGIRTTYTVYNVQAAHTITAIFVPDVYAITATADLNGSISPSGDTILNRGGSVTYTITPDEGYQISNILVDGAAKGAVASYSFTNVTANHTIKAYFKPR